jgi:ribonuclease HII
MPAPAAPHPDSAAACRSSPSASTGTASHRGRVLVRRDAGLYAYERALARGGLHPVAGADEAGRGACAGPLVVAAVVLPPGRRGEVPGLADSKALTPAARERVYAEILARATAWSVVVVEAGELDRRGLHRGNIAGMRRSLARLDPAPAYVLTDGFPVSGLAVPGLAVWKGDQVSACIAAASVLAKVTRDRIMVAMHERWPAYDFATHKGYVTAEHRLALRRHGPCPEHRRCFITVRDVDAFPDASPARLGDFPASRWDFSAPLGDFSAPLGEFPAPLGECVPEVIGAVRSSRKNSAAREVHQ